MGSKELLSRHKITPFKLLTNMILHKTNPNLPPTILPNNMLPKPSREPSQPILLEPPANDRILAGGPSNDNRQK